MTLLDVRKYKPGIQYSLCLATVLATAGLCFIGADIIGYRTVALILLMVVSLLAMLFDVLPVFLSAILSALIWNFLFIPPIFTFHIDNAEDLLMFLMYFFIALVNATLTLQLRKEERNARDREEKAVAINMYNTLLNSLSHELRTPIATVIGAVDTLTENKDKLTPVQQSELYHQIYTAGMRLDRQVGNLLNMSRLESGMLKLNEDWCDINDLISEVILNQDEAARVRIQFMADENLPLFKLDRGILEQVLQNLLHNAVQYTPDPSLIHVTAMQIQDQCVMEIADEGEGIPDHEIPFLFDKFYRLPHTKTGGSGLGLSIVKGFVEAHHGQVSVFRNSFGGTTFRIELPSPSSYINHISHE